MSKLIQKVYSYFTKRETNLCSTSKTSDMYCSKESSTKVWSSPAGLPSDMYCSKESSTKVWSSPAGLPVAYTGNPMILNWREGYFTIGNSPKLPM